MPVRILPDAVVNRIRAGEVVERPAQIVRELVENALDAETPEVRVAVRDGGRALVLVEDDGTGMSPDDLALAVERHATSKLDGDDLFSVSTLGFRGEALAAIGAVTRMTVQTRRDGDDCGWAIDVDNGIKGAIRPCSQRRGTRVAATDLFRAHPARAAFLKKARLEQALVREVVEALALARPDVAFRLESDGRRVLSLSPADWDDRVRAVAGDAFIENSVPFSAEVDGMSVHGRIGLPTWNGHTAVGQRVLVNGRPVRDRVIAASLREVFADVSKERNPAAVVDVRVDKALVDINAHPAKAEIRFRDAGAVAALVRRAAAAAIGASGPVSAARLAEMAAAMARPVDPVSEKDARMLPLGRPMGLALDSFVVSETADGIVITDLHASHERVVLERLKAEALDGGVATRPLPAPVAVNVGEHAAAILDERASDLARLGLGIQAVDAGHVLVTGIPAPIYGTDAARVVTDIASALLDDPHGEPLRGMLDRLCGLFACHSAVRSGDPLTLDEVDGLLREIEATPNAAQCVHGRPTSVKLTRAQVESLFGRR